MVVAFDDDRGTFVLVPDDCEDCGQPLYDTACSAPGCFARCCMDCGTGCDLEVAARDGRCATALAAESPQRQIARINRERAAFGLRPLG